MHDLDTALLRTFTILAETGSFSRTAELIGRTQSAVSSQVRKLEEQLGVTLFIRTTRSVGLTAEAEALRGPALDVLRLCDSLKARAGTGELSGEVRFGAPEDFASAWLPDVLAGFARTHPGVRLHVECDLTRHLVRRFEDGALDVLIVKQKPGAHHPSAHLLWQERLVWAAQAGWQPPTGAILPLVLSPAPCVYRARAASALDSAGLRWRDAYTSPSFAGMVAAVRAGLGVAVMPESSLPDGLVAQTSLPALEPADLAMIESPAAGPAARALAEHVRGMLHRG
jgi:DNA-binding transcriptional LysR family regulator